jgi:hypothetical protein
MAWLAPVVAAQTTDRSGIEGSVTDESGAAMPGVTVVAASPALQGRQTSVVTDGQGRYRFQALPGGLYDLTFELTGFATVRRPGVRLDANFIATIDAKMKVAALAETVTVSAASPVVDARTTAVATNLNKDALEALPTSRSMWQILSMAPGLRITGTPDVGGSAIGTQQNYQNYGTSGGGNRPTIDGVDTREVSTGAGFYYDYGAFQEVQIKAMGNDAEVALPGTNFVGVLKTGSNSFHGSAFIGYESPDWQSDNVDAKLQGQGVTSGNSLKSYYDSNFDLGGPLKRDRLWFYGSYRRQANDVGVVGYSSEPGPDGKWFTADDVAGHNKITVTNATLKLNGQLNPKHRFTAFVQRQKKDQPERGASAYRPREATFGQVFKPLAGKVEWSWLKSDRTLVNFFVGHWEYNTDLNTYSDAESRYDAVTLRYTGAHASYPASNGRGRYQYNGSVTQYVPDFLGGNHDIKAGFEMTTEYRQFGRTARAEGRDYLLTLQNGVPYQVTLYNNPYDADENMTTQSVYARDAWRMGQRFTLNAGVRWERYHVWLPAQSKAAGRFSDAGSFAKTEIRDWRAFAPRVGISWALDSERRTLVKATYGWFNYVTEPGIADDFNKNGAASRTYRWKDLNGDLSYEDGELGTYVSSTGASTRVLNLGVKQPVTHEITATIERQLAADLSARASYVYKRETRMIQAVNIARPYSAYSNAVTTVDPGEDGKTGTSDDGGSVTYYDYAAAYKGSAFEQNKDLNTDGYHNQYQSVEAAVQKRLSNRWQLVSSFLATHIDKWTNGIPQDPNAASFHPKTTYWEWSYKISGSYQLPAQILAALMFTSQSGDVWGREVRFTTGLANLTQLVLLMEDPAARRLPTQNLLNFRVEKRQKLGRAGDISLQLDLFNLTNTNAALAVTARSGSSFGKVTSIISPRIARLGVTYRF